MKYMRDTKRGNGHIHREATAVVLANGIACQELGTKQSQNILSTWIAVRTRDELTIQLTFDGLCKDVWFDIYVDGVLRDTRRRSSASPAHQTYSKLFHVLPNREDGILNWASMRVVPLPPKPYLSGDNNRQKHRTPDSSSGCIEIQVWISEPSMRIGAVVTGPAYGDEGSRSGVSAAASEASSGPTHRINWKKKKPLSKDDTAYYDSYAKKTRPHAEPWGTLRFFYRSFDSPFLLDLAEKEKSAKKIHVVIGSPMQDPLKLSAATKNVDAAKVKFANLPSYIPVRSPSYKDQICTQLTSGLSRLLNTTLSSQKPAFFAPPLDDTISSAGDRQVSENIGKPWTSSNDKKSSAKPRVLQLDSPFSFKVENSARNLPQQSPAQSSGLKASSSLTRCPGPSPRNLSASAHVYSSASNGFRSLSSPISSNKPSKSRQDLSTPVDRRKAKWSSVVNSNLSLRNLLRTPNSEGSPPTASQRRTITTEPVAMRARDESTVTPSAAWNSPTSSCSRLKTPQPISSSRSTSTMSSNPAKLRSPGSSRPPFKQPSLTGFVRQCVPGTRRKFLHKKQATAAELGAQPVRCLSDRSLTRGSIYDGHSSENRPASRTCVPIGKPRTRTPDYSDEKETEQKIVNKVVDKVTQADNFSDENVEKRLEKSTNMSAPESRQQIPNNDNSDAAETWMLAQNAALAEVQQKVEALKAELKRKWEENESELEVLNDQSAKKRRFTVD